MSLLYLTGGWNNLGVLIENCLERNEAALEACIRAAWQGLFAGDRNGGPTAMALQLAQSLTECGRFDPADVLRRYQAWYYREGFDTGRVAAMVFDRMRTMNNEEAVVAVDRELRGMTAGCNPAHRALPLALAVNEVSDEELDSCAIAEARLTHHHPLAAETSIAYLKIMRQLVRGETDLGLVLEGAAEGRSEEVKEALIGQSSRPLDAGGYAPEVLRAAVSFLRKTPAIALEQSIAFSGPDNYCPVLVGPIMGCLILLAKFTALCPLKVPSSIFSRSQFGLISQ